MDDRERARLKDERAGRRFRATVFVVFALSLAALGGLFGAMKDTPPGASINPLIGIGFIIALIAFVISGTLAGVIALSFFNPG